MNLFPSEDQLWSGAGLNALCLLSRLVCSGYIHQLSAAVYAVIFLFGHQIAADSLDCFYFHTNLSVQFQKVQPSPPSLFVERSPLSTIHIGDLLLIWSDWFNQSYLLFPSCRGYLLFLSVEDLCGRWLDSVYKYSATSNSVIASSWSHRNPEFTGRQHVFVCNAQTFGWSCPFHSLSTLI